jgi:hypothetical protein
VPAAGGGSSIRPLAATSDQPSLFSPCAAFCLSVSRAGLYII